MMTSSINFKNKEEDDSEMRGGKGGEGGGGGDMKKVRALCSL